MKIFILSLILLSFTSHANIQSLQETKPTDTQESEVQELVCVGDSLTKVTVKVQFINWSLGGKILMSVDGFKISNELVEGLLMTTKSQQEIEQLEELGEADSIVPNVAHRSWTDGAVFALIFDQFDVELGDFSKAKAHIYIEGFGILELGSFSCFQELK